MQKANSPPYEMWRRPGVMVMIDLYSWDTSNGRKVSIMLEELGLAYRYHPIDIASGDQFRPEFQAISPNNKIPAIVDHDGADGEISLFESAAILIYLAEKTGSDLFPDNFQRRMEVLAWLMFQVGGIGPMFGQALHFHRYAEEENPYGKKRYMEETHRLYGVLEKRLAHHEYLVDTYSVADIAVYPWVARWHWLDIDLLAYPCVKRWFEAISERPAVQRGLIAQKFPPVNSGLNTSLAA